MYVKAAWFRTENAQNSYWHHVCKLALNGLHTLHADLALNVAADRAQCLGILMMVSPGAKSLVACIHMPPTLS